jgi:RNA polymerase sigma-70 factor (ECF subfamily)
MQSALDHGFAFIAGVDEALLVRRLRAGDERAFEELVRTFGGRLLAVARRFVRNDEDAQDIVQSAYLSAFRALDSSRDTANSQPGFIESL